MDNVIKKLNTVEIEEDKNGMARLRLNGKEVSFVGSYQINKQPLEFPELTITLAINPENSSIKFN